MIGTLSAQTLATCSVGGNLGVHPFMKMPFHRPAPWLDFLKTFSWMKCCRGLGVTGMKRIRRVDSGLSFFVLGGADIIGL